MRSRRVAIALFLCAWPVLGVAAEPARLTEVVHRWLDAVSAGGGRRGARSAVFRADSTEDGISGSVAEWIDGEAWRRVTTQGTRAREEVCRDGAAWVKDWNGKVLELQGRDRRDQLTEAAIAALLFGGAARRVSSSGEAVLAPDDAGSDAHVLRFAPKDGLPFTLYIDKATSLPVKAVRKPYDDEITVEFSDWKDVGGRKVPFTVRKHDANAGAGTTTVLGELEWSGPAAGAPIRRPSEGPKDYRVASGHSATGIPFNFENDHLMVLAKVNGSKPLWFMLDTGAEATIVNKARLAELSVQPFGASSVSGGGNSTEFAFADVARLEVGGVTLLNQRDGVIDLSGLEKIYGMPMGGLLGYDFFSRFVVRVNYDAKTLDLLEPSDYAYAGYGAKVPFILEGRCPHATATIVVAPAAPIAADMIVDAGAADTANLTAPFVKEHRLLELARKKPADGPNTMAGSEKEFFAQTSVRGKLNGLTLGRFTLKEIPSNLMVGTTGSYASASFAGTIGEGVLRRFTTTYDYSRNVMILEPNAEFGKPFRPRKTFGATLLSGGPDYTRFTVTGIRKDSPAQAAGLKKDDVIVAIDGKAAAELRLADVRKTFADEGTRHAFNVQRGDERVALDITVTLVSLDEN